MESRKYRAEEDRLHIRISLFQKSRAFYFLSRIFTQEALANLLCVNRCAQISGLIGANGESEELLCLGWVRKLQVRRFDNPLEIYHLIDHRSLLAGVHNVDGADLKLKRLAASLVDDDAAVLSQTFH